MHPLQVVAECTLVDQVRFCVTGLGLCTTIGVKLTSGAQLWNYLLAHVINEKLVTLQLARCICWVAIRHFAPLSTDEDLGTGVLLLGGSVHGRLRPGLRAFHALLGGGLLAFEWGGGGLNTVLLSRKCTFNLGAWVLGGTQEGQKARSRPPHHHRALERPAQHDQH